MRSAEIPTSRALWLRHVERVQYVLFLALQRLRAEQGLPLHEEQLDERLYLKARDVYYALKATERPQAFNLFPKGKHSPVQEADLDEEWLRKQPDFKWRMQDDSAVSREGLTKDFDIESKRLGTPTSQTWVLTEQYVISGITRFLSSSHRYGNNVNDGAMIGYIQDWDVAGILGEVNQQVTAQTEYSIPTLRFSNHKQTVIQTRQTLKRSEVVPSSFCLHHLWVDLRSASTSANA